MSGSDKKGAAPADNKALTAQRFERELANAPADVQDKLRQLLQQMALASAGGDADAGSSSKVPKSMDDHKFWKTQPVVKHGTVLCSLPAAIINGLVNWLTNDYSL